MAQSILVFVSHSSEDKSSLIEPIVSDLEACYINVWIDKRKIIPGENLRQSIFKDGLDKADIVLIFFTQQSLNSAWVDREIKHVLREETKKGNSFDLRKIIAIFDSEEAYRQIADRYPELTDDLMHLMPPNYSKLQIGQLISAIWSKYLSLQGGDVEIQKQLLAKDKELFQKDKELESISKQLLELRNKNNDRDEFDQFADSGKIEDFIEQSNELITQGMIHAKKLKNLREAIAFGLLEHPINSKEWLRITKKGTEFIKWHILKKE